MYSTIRQDAKIPGINKRNCSTIQPAVENGTFHTNPKRKRGNELTPSLALRVSVIGNCGQYILPAVENGTFHTNPKRKRGNELTPSLARFGLVSSATAASISARRD